MNQYNIWNNNNPNNSNNNQHHQQPTSHFNSGWSFPEQPQQLQPQQQQQQQQLDQQISPNLLINKLNNLSSSTNYNNFLQSLDNTTDQNYHYGASNNLNYSNGVNNNVFNLPLELQGGVSNINSRRPSFAAEQSYTHSESSNNPHSLNLLAHSNNFNNFYNNTSGQQNQLLQNFRSRRPSIQINNNPSPQQQQGNGNVELDNGLVLNGNLIITSSILRNEFSKTRNYFCVAQANEFYNHLQTQIANDSFLQKIIINLKKLNNLFNLIKPLVLVLTKAGKFEILSTPINSNILLNTNDVVIVDGDRGKDLVYILDPTISLDVAILINYLKKRQHSKSMNYNNTTSQQPVNPMISNTVDDLVKGQGILDEETQFQIPSKQVLRFATFQEIKNLQFKLMEELKSFKTSLLKISNLSNLHNNLTILNSEYQFDQKKLTFFYFANQRLDFRNLIKELFKIYKTRIWLCAVPKPPNYSNNTSIDLNNVDFENFNVDDFHVRNFNVTLNELIEKKELN